jgi:hypothetical protein
MLRLARIDLASGLVVNVEMAAQDWLDAHANDPDYLFVVDDDPDAPAVVGYGYDPVTGFEQPA